MLGTITDGRSAGPLNGPVGQWVDELTELVVDYGMDTFVFADEPAGVEQVRLFAEEVVPAVRQRLGPRGAPG